MEMIIKLIGLGFKYYFIDKYNIYDFLIILITIIDIILTESSLLPKKGSGGSKTI